MFRSISTFRWKYTNMNVDENCQQNEIFEGKFIKSWWNILEQMRRKVNPAPDGVDDSHIKSERKIQVAKLQIIFRKSLEQQRSHLWQENQEGIRLFRVYTLLHRILSCIIKVSLVQERVRIIWIYLFDCGMMNIFNLKNFVKTSFLILFYFILMYLIMDKFFKFKNFVDSLYVDSLGKIK